MSLSPGVAPPLEVSSFDEFCDRVLFQLFSGDTLLLDQEMVNNNDHDCSISESLSADIQRHNSAQQGELI